MKDEVKEKRRETEEKSNELRDKKKELSRQLIEFNTLKRKKEKDGTLKINENLIRKNSKLQKDKETGENWRKFADESC